MTHIDPEDDPDATRTLFVGNIDATVSEDEIRHMFKKYGIVEDIDMKQAQGRQGQGRPVWESAGARLCCGSYMGKYIAMWFSPN